MVAGALLAIGIVNCGVQNENDPAFALISDYVSNPDVNTRCASAWGVCACAPYSVVSSARVEPQAAWATRAPASGARDGGVRGPISA